MSKKKAAVASSAVVPVAERDKELLAAMQAAGVQPAEMTLPPIDFAYPTTLDALCTQKWAKLEKALISPPMVVKQVAEFPEGEKFEGYKGFVRIEAYLPSGEYVAWSTHLHNKTTGEKGPIAAYVGELMPPFPLRIGSFETSTQGRRVFRPVPIWEP